MSEPIEHRSELDEAEEGDGKLLVTSRDPTVAFDAGKVVLNRVSMRIEAAVEAIGNATGAFWGDADHRAAFCKAMPETIRIESPVGNEGETLYASGVVPPDPATGVKEVAA